MLTADEQTRAAAGMVVPDRLSMLVQDLRSWMSSLLSSRIAHLDKGFLTRVAFLPDENLRSMVNRTSLQHQLLTTLYNPATMLTFYQGHQNFDAAIREPMLSAMEQADPKYQSWINSPRLGLLLKLLQLNLSTSRLWLEFIISLCRPARRRDCCRQHRHECFRRLSDNGHVLSGPWEF